jgi:DNA-binding MarR family transcriptional regulator
MTPIAGNRADDGESGDPVHPWPGRLGPAAFDAGPASNPPFRSVGFTVSTLGYEVSRRFRETLQPLGLEPRDFSLLRAVASNEGRSQQAVGESLKIAPSRMVAFVDLLESRGLLERRQNADDRRTRALYLTDAGRDLLASAFGLALETERTLCSGLTEDDRSLLLDLLGRVAAALGLPDGVHAAHRHAALPDE